MEKTVYPLLKSFGLYASSILSMAIVLSGSSLRAEESLPTLRASQTTTSELDSLLGSEPVPEPLSTLIIANSTTANLDQVAFKPALHPTPLEDWFATSEELAEPAPSLQQADLSTERLAEVPESVESIESSTPPSSSERNELEPPGSAIDLTEIESTEPTLSPDPIAQNEPDPQPTESLSSSTPNNRWQFSVEPYFYLPFDVDADITVDGRSTSLDLGLDDILNLDRVFDAGLRLEAQHNRWSIILDGFYVYGEDSRRLGGRLLPEVYSNLLDRLPLEE